MEPTYNYITLFTVVANEFYEIFVCVEYILKVVFIKKHADYSFLYIGQLHVKIINHIDNMIKLILETTTKVY